MKAAAFLEAIKETTLAELSPAENHIKKELKFMWIFCRSSVYLCLVWDNRRHKPGPSRKHVVIETHKSEY